jgi:hypothetical protein
MTRPRWSALLAVIGALGHVGTPALAWAHHPMPRPEAGGEWPWPLLWFLGAGVFMVVFVATWAVFSFLERRQRSGSGGRESSRRS